MNSTHTQLPQGYELSADPRYAYNKNNGHWLDMQTGAVSYYDESSQIYIPIDTTLAATDAQGFDGVARLVISTMAVSKGKRDVAKAVKVDIRQEHMDNLNAIKQKYAAVHRRQKPSQGDAHYGSSSN
ncbi:hypothetical protein LPJ55_005407 [Coemansia sp. RSA 990]|nr:hypothetical protein LPJ55_005407 [Coemansia sp. RSA 990]